MTPMTPKVVIDHASAFQDNYPIRMPGDVRIVRDDHYRLLLLIA